MRLAMRTALAVLVLALGTTCAMGAPITFTWDGTASGTVGMTSFVDAAFTITMTADTDSVGTGPYYMYLVGLSTTIDVAGIGTATFTAPKQILVAPEYHGLGFEAVGGYDYLDMSSTAFDTYDLTTDLGPVFDAAPVAVGQFANVGSSLGDITLVRAYDVTFNARTEDSGSVPEPSALAFVLCGAVGAGLLRGLRRR